MDWWVRSALGLIRTSSPHVLLVIVVTRPLGTNKPYVPYLNDFYCGPLNNLVASGLGSGGPWQLSTPSGSPSGRDLRSTNADGDFSPDSGRMGAVDAWQIARL